MNSKSLKHERIAAINTLYLTAMPQAARDALESRIMDSMTVEEVLDVVDSFADHEADAVQTQINAEEAVGNTGALR